MNKRIPIAAALLFCGIALANFVAFVTQPPLPSSMASEKARRLAEGISEMINSIVFASATCTLPLIAGLVLRSRARRAKGAK